MEYKLSDLIDIKHGFAFKSQFFLNGSDKKSNLILLTPGNIKIGGGFNSNKIRFYSTDGPLPEEYILEPDDIIVNMTDLSKDLDTLGSPAIIPNNLDYQYLHNQRLGKVEVLETGKLNKLYLYYVFLTREYRHYVIATSSGTTVHHTSPSRILEYRIKLPNYRTQNKISNLLNNYDQKIELNNKIIANLEAQAQAIFKSWFIDFEPFQDGDFVESELGLIPEGWEVGRLGDHCLCLLGGTPSRKKEYYWNGNIGWINSGEVNKNRIIEPLEYITEEGLINSSTKKLPPKTTLIAITGATLGQISLLEIECCTNQSIVGILENSEMPYEYIYLFIKNNINTIIANQTGAAQQHINLNDVKDSILLVPPSGLTKKYTSIVKPMFSQVSSLYFENKTLAQIRDTLLPKLMSGEIDVSNITIDSEEDDHV